MRKPGVAALRVQCHPGAEHGHGNRPGLAPQPVFLTISLSRNVNCYFSSSTPNPSSQFLPHVSNLKLCVSLNSACPTFTTFTPEPVLVSMKSDCLRVAPKPESQDSQGWHSPPQSGPHPLLTALSLQPPHCPEVKFTDNDAFLQP